MDAARSEHRELITAIGQAQYGVDAREFPSYVGVVNQLWDDDPSEVWAAAERLIASGLGRERVMEQLARVWRRHGRVDSDELQAGHLSAGDRREEYAAALSRLG